MALEASRFPIIFTDILLSCADFCAVASGVVTALAVHSRIASGFGGIWRHKPELHWRMSGLQSEA